MRTLRIIVAACVVGITALAFRYLSGPRPVFLQEGASDFVPIKLVRKTEISPELRNQIKRCYAEDNRLLEERLRRAQPPSIQRKT